MNAKEKLLGKIAIFAIAGAMVLGQAVGVGKTVTAGAQDNQEEIIYYEDMIYGDNSYNGQGVQTSSSYNITCDEMVVVDYAVHMSAPTYTTYESTMTNYCGAMAGRNVVIFYDRWLTNLVPNFTPGMVTGSGIYRYYPDLGMDATDAVMSRLYDLMQIAQIGGTTSQNFKNGLSSYASEKGYSTSYSSFYGSATSVNLNTLTTAINQNKVGVIMCTQYNFVYEIIPYEEQGFVQISRINSTTAHMMMVYGYQTLAFYLQGNHVCTKTFLYVSSGFGDGDQGYMELNDFSVINEAVIVSMT